MFLKSLMRDERGSPAVEFAFITPMLFVMTLGMVDIGRLGLASTTMQFAVADAARFAIAHGPRSPDPKVEADIENFAKARIVGIPEAEIVINVAYEDAVFQLAGTKVTVTATHSVTLFISGFMPWLAPVPVDREATMTFF